MVLLNSGARIVRDEKAWDLYESRECGGLYLERLILADLVFASLGGLPRPGKRCRGSQHAGCSPARPIRAVELISTFLETLSDV
jgi:hypothetical protein